MSIFVLHVTLDFFSAYKIYAQRWILEVAFKEAKGLPELGKRIWEAIQELIIAIANLFGLTDEDIYDAMINRSDGLNHICDIYKLKLAS